MELREEATEALRRLGPREGATVRSSTIEWEESGMIDFPVSGSFNAAADLQPSNTSELPRRPSGAELHEAARRATRVLRALHDYASHTGQLFTNGTFLVQDHQQKLCAYLQPVAYLRLSSHLTQLPQECGAWHSESIFGVYQYGIDIAEYHFEAPCETAGEPHVKGCWRTVLFHPVRIQGEWLLFLKPEDNGLGSWDQKVNHAKDYVYNCVVGDHDTGRKRKERVASLVVPCEQGDKRSVQKLFLQAAIDLGIEECEAVKIAHLGVSWMLEVLDNDTQQGADAASALRLAVMSALQMDDCADEERFQYRIGAEVFVPAHQLKDILDKLPTDSLNDTSAFDTSAFDSQCSVTSMLDGDPASMQARERLREEVETDVRGQQDELERLATVYQTLVLELQQKLQRREVEAAALKQEVTQVKEEAELQRLEVQRLKLQNEQLQLQSASQSAALEESANQSAEMEAKAAHGKREEARLKAENEELQKQVSLHVGRIREEDPVAQGCTCCSRKCAPCVIS